MASFRSTLAPVQIKLDHSNYIFWKSQILPVARAHDLETFLLGTKSKPSEAITDPANPTVSLVNSDYTSWLRIDQFVMIWLLTSISEQMLGHVVHCHSSAEVWAVLEKLSFTKSKAKALQLCLALQSTKKGGDTIEDYILKMKAMANSLMATG